MKITDIDKNFLSPTVDETGMIYIDVKSGCFEIDGFPYLKKNGDFFRMDKETNSVQNVWVQQLAWHTSGGMVRFVTNSKRIAVKCEIENYFNYAHCSLTGIFGMDIYTGSGSSKKYFKTVVPTIDSSFYNCSYDLSGKTTEITVNMPTYSGVKSFEIGLDKDCIIEKPTPFTIKKPICFYGSSITQGCCACRPGNAYTNMLGRMVDAEVYNLGFSGSAHGEIVMADYICNLDISAFILDYDHNTPTVEHLENTHYPFYKYVRDRKPNIPIIILSKPDYAGDGTVDELRRAVIIKTFKKAKKDGDKNVYFIDGKTIFGKDMRDACTVDACHPNDLGFYRMTKKIYPVLKKALEK